VKPCYFSMSKTRCQITWRICLTLVTATWNVYSVTRLGVLFEKCAWIEMIESSDLDALNIILTEVFETVKSFERGRLLSSGNAELNFQSSSTEPPFGA